MSPAEKIAAAFHAKYEALAPHYDYETREASAVPWRDVPEANRQLMTAVVGSLLAAGVIKPGGGLTRGGAAPLTPEVAKTLRDADWQNERDQRYEHWRLHLLDVAAEAAAEAYERGRLSSPRKWLRGRMARRCLWLVAVGREGEAAAVLANHGVELDVSIIAPGIRAQQGGMANIDTPGEGADPDHKSGHNQNDKEGR